MKIAFNVKRGYVFAVVGLIVVFCGVFFVNAFNSPVDPSIMGHSVGEIEGMDDYYSKVEIDAQLDGLSQAVGAVASLPINCAYKPADQKICDPGEVMDGYNRFTAQIHCCSSTDISCTAGTKWISDYCNGGCDCWGGWNGYVVNRYMDTSIDCLITFREVTSAVRCDRPACDDCYESEGNSDDDDSDGW